jgi:hypothetical protein
MRGRLADCAVLVAMASLGAPDGAAAWGSAGHWAIGEIASHYLTPRTRLAVDRLLEPGPYGTLAAAGYWADAHARLYRAYDEYVRRHSVDVAPGADRIVLERDCPEDCVLTAIESLTGSLRAGEPPSGSARRTSVSWSISSRTCTSRSTSAIPTDRAAT